VNIDYLLNEFPNSTFNYHRAFSAETKKKIISQISNTPLAFETFTKIKEIMLDEDNRLEYTNTELFYDHAAISMGYTFLKLSQLGNACNHTIY